MFGMRIKYGAEFEESPAIRFVWFCQFHCSSIRICHLFEQNPPVPSSKYVLCTLLAVFRQMQLNHGFTPTVIFYFALRNYSGVGGPCEFFTKEG